MSALLCETEMCAGDDGTDARYLLVVAFSEHLKSVPDQLETLMTEKRLLLASLILVRSLKTITKPEMMEIGALADLRAYLLGQEVVSAILDSRRWRQTRPDPTRLTAHRRCARSSSRSSITTSTSSPTTATLAGSLTRVDRLRVSPSQLALCGVFPACL